MSRFDFSKSPGLFIEITPTSWLVQDGEEFLEIPSPAGGASRDGLVAALKGFLQQKGWRPRLRAVVAIGARGVSLRRMLLPPTAKDDLPRVLRLQIESEFPLSPDELAWGWQVLGQNSGRQEVLVVAVKKELLEPYTQILTECGVTPVFALAALARSALAPLPVPTGAVLHIGLTESELLSFQDSAPSSIRLLGWGSNSGTPLPKGITTPIYLTGRGCREFATATSPVLELGVTGDHSAAIEGLKKQPAPLLLQASEEKNPTVKVGSWKWAAAAVVLLLALIFLPYVEAILLQPHLAKKLAALQSDRQRLPAIDHELEFLQFLKRSEPPYLDTLFLMSKLAPQGTSFENLTMNRRGELSVRGKLHNADEVTQLRSNMVHSAWFSSVSVEEQTPTPDRQVTIRMTAQIKPVDARKPIVEEPPAKPEKK